MRTIKDWLILAFCTTGNLISFYVDDRVINRRIAMYRLAPARYMYIVMRQSGYIIGYELNAFGRLLLT